MKIGLHNISNIKSGSASFYKTELQEKLMGNDVEHGAHAIAISEINGMKLTALAYSGNCYVATGCISTLPGKPAEKKRYHPEGSRSPSKCIPCCKMIKE
eukprot:12048749-Ditylum_brightwellii.AAC.1